MASTDATRLAPRLAAPREHMAGAGAGGAPFSSATQRPLLGAWSVVQPLRH